MMETPQVYRSGAYGCIFSPPLPPKVASTPREPWQRRKNRFVGKIFFNVESGLQEAEAMYFVNKYVDPESLYTLPMTTVNFVSKDDVINVNIHSRFMCVSFFDAPRSTELGSGNLGGWSNGFPPWFRISRSELARSSMDALLNDPPPDTYLQVVYPYAGRTLQEEIASPKLLVSTHALIRGLMNVFRGVRALTRMFLVHQDLKDNNVCVGETGQDMRIIDLGVTVGMHRLMRQGRETLQSAKAPEYRVHMVHHTGLWRRERTRDAMGRRFVREACAAMLPLCRNDAMRAQLAPYARWYWAHAVPAEDKTHEPLADPTVTLRAWNGVPIRARTRFDSAKVGYADRIDVFMLGVMISEFVPSDLLMPRMTAVNPAHRPSIEEVMQHFQSILDGKH